MKLSMVQLERIVQAANSELEALLHIVTVLPRTMAICSILVHQVLSVDELQKLLLLKDKLCKYLEVGLPLVLAVVCINTCRTGRSLQSLKAVHRMMAMRISVGRSMRTGADQPFALLCFPLARTKPCSCCKRRLIPCCTCIKISLLVSFLQSAVLLPETRPAWQDEGGRKLFFLAVHGA